jgi:hypothetical protein
MRICAVNQLVSGDRRGHRDPLAELVGAQQREFLAGLHDKSGAVVVAAVDDIVERVEIDGAYWNDADETITKARAS